VIELLRDQLATAPVITSGNEPQPSVELVPTASWLPMIVPGAAA
jgi:hypothetical protein